ncbi:hypothetical protein LEQ06_07305 [Paraclostridium sp. AKS46]|nr:hypothetical protein [Paraclostridium sp. AKS46]
MLGVSRPVSKYFNFRKTNLTSIIISNTYKKKVEDISLLFEKGFSSKGEERGMGLSNLKIY